MLDKTTLKVFKKKGTNTLLFPEKHQEEKSNKNVWNFKQSLHAVYSLLLPKNEDVCQHMTTLPTVVSGHRGRAHANQKAVFPVARKHKSWPVLPHYYK